MLRPTVLLRELPSLGPPHDTHVHDAQAGAARTKDAANDGGSANVTAHDSTTSFRQGDIVKAEGLLKAVEFNGCLGVVLKNEEKDTHRVEVRMRVCDKELKEARLLRENLQLIEKAPEPNSTFESRRENETQTSPTKLEQQVSSLKQAQRRTVYGGLLQIEPSSSKGDRGDFIQLKAELGQVSADLTSKSNLCVGLEASLRSAQDNAERLDKKCESLECENRRLHSSIQGSKAQGDTAVKDAKRIKSLEAQVTKLRDEKQTTITENEGLHSALKRASTGHAGICCVCAINVTDVVCGTHAVAICSPCLGSKTPKVPLLFANIKDIYFHNILHQVPGSCNRNCFNTNACKIGERGKNLRSELDESESKLKAAEIQLRASQTELKASQSQLSGVQSQLSGVQAELTAARLEMTEMRSRFDQLEHKRKSEGATRHSEQEQQDAELGRRPKVEQQVHSSGSGNAGDLRSLIQAEVQAEIRRNSQQPSATPSRLNSVEEGSHPGYYTRRPENPQQYSQRGNFYDPRDERAYYNPRGDPRFDDRREYFMLPRFNY